MAEDLDLDTLLDEQDGDPQIFEPGEHESFMKFIDGLLCGNSDPNEEALGGNSEEAVPNEEVLGGNSDPEEGAVCNDAPPKQAPSSPEVDEARQQRLERNRISASQSRQRKKSYVQDLEAKCRMLEARCSQLEQSVNFVYTENTALKGEVARLKMAKNCVAEPAVPVMDSLQLEFLLRSSSHQSSLQLLSLLWTTLVLFLVCGSKRLGDLLLLHHHQQGAAATTTRGPSGFDRALKSSSMSVSSTSSSLLWWPP